MRTVDDDAGVFRAAFNMPGAKRAGNLPVFSGGHGFRSRIGIFALSFISMIESALV